MNVDVPPDPSKVVVRGPGIEPGNVVGEQTYFDVITAGELRCFIGSRPIFVCSTLANLKAILFAKEA